MQYLFIWNSNLTGSLPLFAKFGSPTSDSLLVNAREGCSPTSGPRFCNARHLVATRARRKPRTHSLWDTTSKQRCGKTLRRNYALMFKKSLKLFLIYFFGCGVLDQINSLESPINLWNPLRVIRCWRAALRGLRPWAPLLTGVCECTALSLISVVPSIPSDCLTRSTGHPAVSIKYNKCQAGAIVLSPGDLWGDTRKQVFPIHYCTKGVYRIKCQREFALSNGPLAAHWYHLGAF